MDRERWVDFLEPEMAQSGERANRGKVRSRPPTQAAIATLRSDKLTCNRQRLQVGTEFQAVQGVERFAEIGDV
ncbi:MAG: hypothetical protein GEEBNDBF_01049 [bacterium]|nr:hypothetical protein [bacterium]